MSPLDLSSTGPIVFSLSSITNQAAVHSHLTEMFILVNSTDHVERITVQNKPASVLSAISVTVGNLPNGCLSRLLFLLRLHFVWDKYNTHDTIQTVYTLYAFQ